MKALLNSRKQSLDVLRGIAVLMVIASHYSLVLPRRSFLLETGWVGVDLFFVLSGFLISGLLFSEVKASGTINVKRFLIRRGFKIYPAFYALIGLTAVVALAQSRKLPPTLLGEAVFLQNYLPSFWPHTWSLAVEEHFYLSLPLLLLFLVRLGKGKANPFRLIPSISICLAVLCLYMRIVAFRHGAEWAKVALPTHLRMDALFAGVTLGYYAQFDQQAFRDAGKSWVLIVGIVFTSTLPFLPDVPRLTFAYVAFCFIVAWAVNQPESSNRLARLLAWIGYYSYSIYLWHVVSMLALEHMPPRWYRFPAYAILAIVFGVLMAELIELPVLHMRERYFPSRSNIRCPSTSS